MRFYIRTVLQENRTYLLLNTLSPIHLDKVLDSGLDIDAPLNKLCDLLFSIFCDTQSYGEAKDALYARRLLSETPLQFVDELMRLTHIPYPSLSA
ncbi:unnamed protein product [Schistocephalus solidus]|uniref:ACOX domain-containing protein n=1 Tax=Schistocephalus solidus TaxID=70667 RepID=A0A183T8P9_SCHSO|nr:unnamed protein product [Schistocephalus solidus]